jgi:hypothetical protein
MKIYPEGSPYIIDRVGEEYNLIGLKHCGNGSSALYHTGELEECKNAFYEMTKKFSNEQRVLYVIDEDIKFKRII